MPPEQGLPPCAKATIENIRDGGNPPHSARFTLAALLLRIGWTVQDIVTLFETVADFNAATTRYQATNIRDEEYLPMNCEKMHREGLCPVMANEEDDALCETISNPIEYIRSKGLINNHA